MKKNFLIIYSLILGFGLLFSISCKDEKEEPEPIVTVTDIDGNVYNGVKIGKSVWMTGNLQVSHYRNGDPIPNVTDATEWGNLTIGACCWYDNDSATYNNPYGRLYNWHAVNDSRGLAPEGWHVASEQEIENLITYLGGYSEAGGRLKATGTTYWNSPNTGADNQSGFSGIPGGFRYDGIFHFIGDYTLIWSSTDNFDVLGLGLSYNSSSATDNNFNKNCGFTVRCVKD
jgi:uncharacterized protein (TIGR02145 family)